MIRTIYSISGEEIKGQTLAVFYEGNTVIDGGGWSLNGFLNSDKFEVKRIDFIQGNDRKHDSHHVWYVTK